MPTINDKYRNWREQTQQALLKDSTKSIDWADQYKVSSDQQGVVINKVTVRPVYRQSQDIAKWRNALITAEQVYQQREQIYDLYADILLDGRLKQLIQQRITRITNTTLRFYVDNKEVPEISVLATRKYFRKFIQESLNSRFWGHSLLELLWPAAGSADKGITNLIPRKHVKPKFGIVCQNTWDTEGIPYREDPYRRNCIEVGEPDDLGLILEACPHVIFKRGGFGDWAEFAEVFGMPFRWATYQNEQSRLVLEQALEKAGSAGYVVAPEDAQLQFHNPTAGSQSNDIFRFLIDACNQELSITILGNTMTTTEAKHSGYAQSETQWKTQDELHADDRKFILTVLNEDLNAYLARLGYAVGKGEWRFDDGDGLSLTQRIEIDLKVATMVPIAEEYWYEKYQLPRPEGDAMVDDDEEGEDDTDDTPEPDQSKRRRQPGKP